MSNVLNRPDQVASATRDRVLAAIEELQFVRNASARQLRAGTLQSIGVVLLDIANPFFTAVARGIEDRLAVDEYTLMLSSSDEKPEREARYLRLFEEHGVQGVMVTPSSAASLETLLAVRERGIDTVLLDATSPLETPVLGRGRRRPRWCAGRRAPGRAGPHPDRVPQRSARPSGSAPTVATAWSLPWSQAGLDPAEALVEVTIPAR